MQMPRDNFSRISPGFLMPPPRGMPQAGKGKATESSAALTQRGTVGFVSAKANPSSAVAVQEKRRRRRVAVAPMYTSVLLRNLSQRTAGIEGHVLDVCENGIAIEADFLVPVGQVVTVEFQVAGIGHLRQQAWPEFAAACEVVRHDDVEDFPQGPYKMALRFVKVSTMAQAQIARFVATQHD